MSTQVEKIVREVPAPMHHEMPCMYQLYNIVEAESETGKKIKVRQPSRMVCKADLEREIAQLEVRLAELQSTLAEVVVLESESTEQ